MDPQLFERSIRLRQDLKRNVIYIPPPDLIYKALLDEGDSIEIPTKAAMQARTLMSGMDNDDDFIYTTAIEYPFKTEPYMYTRYSNGTYPVWYGSKMLETSIYETVYHTKKFISSIAGYDSEQSIVRQRSVYNVFCDTILIDVVSNEKHSELLISDDYSFTQNLGSEIKKIGYAGLQSPAARHPGGINANIFNKDVLSVPKLFKHLNYIYLTSSNVVEVYDDDELLFLI